MLQAREEVHTLYKAIQSDGTAWASTMRARIRYREITQLHVKKMSEKKFITILVCKVIQMHLVLHSANTQHH